MIFLFLSSFFCHMNFRVDQIIFRWCELGWIKLDSYLDIEPDLIHAPLIISESECNSNTETKSTSREKLQDKLCGGRNNGQMTHRDTDLLVWDFHIGPQDRLDFTETAKHLVQRMSESCEFDFVPPKRAARYLVRKSKAALRFREDRIVMTRSRSSCLQEEHDGSGGSDLRTHCEIWIDAPELVSTERWRYVVYAVVKTGSSWTILEIIESGSGNHNDDWNA